MKRILTSVVALLCFAATTVFAQGGYQVKGVVVDQYGPVIGATVMEQGTQNGVSTGLDGDFAFTVSGPSAVVEISCIGYSTQTFTASQLPAEIFLADDTEFLDDVVVIGYGTVKKSDLTGSVSTVKADEINKGVITTPADLLRGKSAGVVVTSGSGMPGSGATVRIRGGSTINDGANTPLYVIDGLPVSNDGIAGMSDPLSSINPEDIESFTVLKDASATAIYGSRAANGVIVITTKKGSKTATTMPQVAVDLTTSVNTISKYNDVLDTDGLRKLLQDYFGPNSAAEQHMGIREGGEQKFYNTNWQKEIFRTALTYDGNVSVNGRLGFLPYRVSGGFTEQNGTLKGSKMDRATAAINLAPSFFDKHLSVNLNGKYTYAKNWYADQGAIGSALNYDPSKPVYNQVPGYNIGGFTAWHDDSGNVNTMGTQNPVAMLEAKDDTANAHRFIGNAQFDYKIHGFEDLRLNLNLGIDWALSKGTTDIAPGSESSWHNTRQAGGGSHTEYDYSRRNTTLEFYGDYNKTFAEKHNVDFMAGYSWQHFYSNNSNKTIRISDGSTLGEGVGEGELYLISFFGRANYSFADRYLLTATLRADGTSRFQNHKWGIFPSVAFGWNVLNEPFAESLKDKLSTLKLRLSWGETGQQEVGGYYDTFAQFYRNKLGSYYYFGDQLIHPISALGYSADLRWETTVTYNIGIDTGFKNDRYTASLDVYKRDTRDILNWIPVPALSNLTNYLNTNIGNMTNYGVELDLNAIVIDTRDMSWTIGGNIAYNHNEITKLTQSEEASEGVATGGISGGVGNNIQMHQVGHPMRSFYVYQQVYDEAGKPICGVYVDRNEDGKVDSDDMYFYHKPDADVTLGFNTSFTYKNWTAALSGHASFGNWVYNNVASTTEPLSDLWANTFVCNRLSTAPDSMFGYGVFLSDYYVTNASFLKLDNLTVGYTFPQLFKIAPERHASLNVFGTVQNICTITGYKGLDPEIYGGIDGSVYPRPRTFVVGVKFNF